MLNAVQIQGRLGKDPELRYTNSQKPVVSLTVCSDRDGKDSGCDWIDCIAWNGIAEFLSKYFKKGDPICFEGSLRRNNWKDKDGNARSRLEVLITNVHFCIGKGKPEAASEAKAQDNGFADIPDEEFPF